MIFFFAKNSIFLAEICQICSREDDFLVDFEKKMLQNAYLDAKIGFDPAENEPPKECCVAAHGPGRRGALGRVLHLSV